MYMNARQQRYEDIYIYIYIYDVLMRVCYHSSRTFPIRCICIPLYDVSRRPAFCPHHYCVCISLSPHTHTHTALTIALLSSHQ